MKYANNYSVLGTACIGLLSLYLGVAVASLQNKSTDYCL